MNEIIKGEIQYKYDPVDLLKEKGITSYTITKELGYSPSLMQKLRSGSVSIATVKMLCELLNCQPGDIIEFVK